MKKKSGLLIVAILALGLLMQTVGCIISNKYGKWEWIETKDPLTGEVIDRFKVCRGSGSDCILNEGGSAYSIPDDIQKIFHNRK